MTKAIVNLHIYKPIVLSMEDAVTLTRILGSAEIHEKKYGSNNTSHFIYANDTAEVATISIISESLYQMAKLAGHPDKD